MKKNSEILLITFSILGFLQCTKKIPDCEGGNSIFGGTSLTIDFKDSATNHYLYKENTFGAKYHKDSLKMFDEFGNKLILKKWLEQIDNTPSRYYRISALPIIDFRIIDSAKLLKGVFIKYFIHFNFKEKDSINAYFKVFAPPNKCYESSFEEIKIYYKQKLIHSDSFAIGTVFKLLKP